MNTITFELRSTEQTLDVPYGKRLTLVAGSSLFLSESLAQNLAFALGVYVKRGVALYSPLERDYWHPSQHRALLPHLLAQHPRTQHIVSTSSPLVFLSMECHWNAETDVWLDVSATAEGMAVVEERTFYRVGDANGWLTTAFGLPSPYSVEKEAAIERAAAFGMKDQGEGVTREEYEAVDAELRNVLGDTDTYWLRWRYLAERQGWAIHK